MKPAKPEVAHPMRFYPLILCCLLVGCSTGGTDSLEAQLRVQDEQIQRLQNQLAESQRATETLTAEARSLRNQLTNPGEVPHREQIATGLAVKNLEINNLLTGLTDDGKLHAVVRPVDAEGDLVKLPGRLHIRLLDMSSAEGSEEIADWTWEPTEARELWTSAAIGAGYVVDLPLEDKPAGDELILHARFIPADGRQFDATHAISVR